MDRRAHTLLSLVIAAVVISILSIYWRSIVQKDFYIVESETTELEQVELL